MRCLVVEPLPAYAPDLNPVGPLWANLKAVELANLAGDSLDEVIAAAQRGIQRIRGTHHLVFSFLRSCGLSLCEQCPPRQGASFFEASLGPLGRVYGVACPGDGSTPSCCISASRSNCSHCSAILPPARRKMLMPPIRTCG